MSYVGRYLPKYPEKYLGVGKVPIYKSRNELVVFNRLDTDPKVIRWGYEIIKIPYFFRVDSRIHRYEADIYCEIMVNNVIQKYIIEIKSSDDLIPPQKPKVHSLKGNSNYRRNQFTYIKNMDKWTAAKQFCDANNIKFLLLTEKEIFKHA